MIMNKDEYQAQVKFVQWLNIKKIFYFAIFNENQQSSNNKLMAIKIAQKHKMAGRIKGTSDIFVMLPNKILFIELKRPKKRLKSGKLSSSNSKVSDEQKVFLSNVNEFSYAYGFVAYGFDEARNIIERELK